MNFIDIAKKKVKEIDISEQYPFFHGTSMENAEKIMKEGLKPRSETGKRSVWEEHSQEKDLSSEKGMVYFAECQDDLPRTSAAYALRDQGKEYNKQEIAFLKLKNPEKYIGKMVDDEDYSKNFNDLLKETFYYDRTHNYSPLYLGTGNYCLKRMPKKIIDAMDITWASCHKEYDDEEICNRRMESIIESIPNGVRSLHSIRTFAIKGSVDPEDLELFTYDQWKNRSCPKQSGGCLKEEEELKKEYAHAMKNYNMFWNRNRCELYYMNRGIYSDKELNWYCEKIPEDYKNPNRNGLMEGLTEEKVGKLIKEKMAKTKQNLISYIYENKIQPKS